MGARRTSAPRVRLGRAPCALLVLFAAAAAGGCGAAKSMPGAPGAAPPSDVDALSRELEAAERDLNAELGVDRDEAQAGAEQVTESAGEVKAQEPPEAPKTEAKKDASPVSRCRDACRALGSMRRSSERICEIAGAGAERCTWAKSKLSEAEARVRRAGCACSADNG